jgi:methylenetetrahydrofolate dehydrogenase (NADP+) / methenyltetrahydrofolate cyclohydrolase
MHTKIIDGNKIKNEMLTQIRREVETLPFTPIFCDILVGSDIVSASYVRMKAKLAESVGIKFRTAEFPESVTTESLIEAIENLNTVPHMSGIIVQLPLPFHIDKDRVLDAISPMLDVDCLGSIESAKFYNDEPGLQYPTALACMRVLAETGLLADVGLEELKKKKVVVLGQGKLVGKPVTHLLESKGVSVEKITRNTPNTVELIKSADIIISAIGQGKFIAGGMVKEGVIIIDAGTSEEDGGVVGDVDSDSVDGVASAVSPTPGGVGPVTVAYLLSNVLEVAKSKILVI